MDVEHGIVDRFGSGEPGYLARLGGAITAARDARIAVIYVTVGFRPGYPEVSPRNKIFGGIAGLRQAEPAATRPARCIRPLPRRRVR